MRRLARFAFPQASGAVLDQAHDDHARSAFIDAHVQGSLTGPNDLSGLERGGLVRIPTGDPARTIAA